MPKRVDFARTVRVAGISARTTNAREMDAASAAIPGLWGRFYEQPPPAAASPVYSVYTEYESDVNGAYSVVVGREAASGAGAEKVVTIPAGRYLEFTSTGEMPGAVVAAWKQLWDYFARPGAPARAYAVDFEYHDPKTPQTVRVYVSVK